MIRGHSYRTTAAFALIALALWLRLLVPAGWMPSEAGFGIRPCLPEAAAAAAHDHHASSHHHGHHGAAKPETPKHSGEICAFTALALALAAPPLPPLLPEATPAPVPLPAMPLRHAGTLLALASPPPPATGPPLRS
jgi:hypothetical protein